MTRFFRLKTAQSSHHGAPSSGKKTRCRFERRGADRGIGNPRGFSQRPVKGFVHAAALRLYRRLGGQLSHRVAGERRRVPLAWPWRGLSPVTVTVPSSFALMMRTWLPVLRS
jgi:hypothetical protein